MSEIALKLYITGVSSESDRVLAILHDICKEHLPAYQVEVIDVLQNPRLAEADKIVATPTVVRVIPEPKCQVIGDLADRGDVIIGLRLQNAQDPLPLEGGDNDSKN